MDRIIGESLVSICYRSGEKWVRLLNPADWERAVHTGDILPTSMVVIEHTPITEAVYAGAIDELAAYFHAPKLTLIEAMDCALVGKSTPAEEPVWSVEPNPRTTRRSAS